VTLDPNDRFFERQTAEGTMTNRTLDSARARFAVARDRFDRAVQPTADALPNRRVLWSFPALIAVFFVIMVATGISGTSSGNYWATFGDGQKDPALISGEPRGIRSDEWLVQSSWIVSQEEQGFPVENQTLPGGMDLTVQNDAPTWDWSTAFRPHIAGFLALPLDQGMAVRWWLPGLAVIVAAYLFSVTMMPRRPVISALLAVGLFFTPILQWWFLPTTLWPVALAFTAMAAIIWIFRHPRLGVRIAWAAVTGYLAVTTAMSIYAPFIVPAALVVLFFFIGAWISEARRQQLSFRASLVRISPLLAAAVGAGVVMVLWILTRLDTIKALFGTVYPGQRLEGTGLLSAKGLVSLFAGPFNEALTNSAFSQDQSNYLGANQSEAAGVVLYAFFFLIPLAWIVVADWRASRRLNWIALAVIGCTVFVTAYLLIPGWDAIAHLLFVDRTTVARIRLAYAILGIVSIVVLLKRLDKRDIRLPGSVVWTTVALTAGSILFTAVVLTVVDPLVPNLAAHWRITAVLIVLGVFFILKRWAVAGAAVILVAALFIGSGVNPLYRGVFDLNDTEIGEAVDRVNAEDPGTWVGIGSYVPTAVLVESGVRAMNGVQTYPPTEMWDQIDPDDRYEEIWNRLANVNWVPGEGEPVPTNPVRDQIHVSFDACSDFAEEHVSYVLSEVPIDETCATPIETVTEGGSTLTIYEVQPDK
jgi:hypothetical protein